MQAELGGGANSLAQASLRQNYHSVICSETAKISAPEIISNSPKLLVKTKNDKLTPQAIRLAVINRQDIHASKPRVVTHPAHRNRHHARPTPESIMMSNHGRGTVRPPQITLPNAAQIQGKKLEAEISPRHPKPRLGETRHGM
ncbi:hypothetical protein PSEUDO8Z_60266 [Pseudomonas sp. 8Z]|nr:hypothetical protein PSEUDO8Z_60266 [Pseudomonas sp. 8Z]